MGSQPYRTQPRKNYTDDFKMRMVELASQPGACVAQIAREYGINDNVIFKWLRLWQNEGRISRRLPATVTPPSHPALLPVEIVPESAPSDISNAPCMLAASSCCVELRHGKISLENPSAELLSMLLRELTGRNPG